MDIYKLLSRSTKQKNKAVATRDARPTKLPSAGTSANPQLYHDVVESRGKKRKRGIEQPVEETREVEESVDFFAPKDAVPQKKKEEGQNAKYNANERAVELLDSEECRRILRSHRLKVTLLSAGRSQDKKIKKSKKGKVVKKPVKEEYRQLFPQPLQSFAELRTIYEISNRMAENLADQGYKIPTEVQMGSLPLLLQPERALGDEADVGDVEVDLLAVAPTGSGKTLAFLIPIVNQIIQRRRKSEDKAEYSLEAVVVAPTKELASQIVNEAKKLSLGTGVKVVGMKKGMRVVGDDEAGVEKDSSSDEEDDEDEDVRKKGTTPRTKVDILVTTPGLLLSSISAGGDGGQTPLADVKTLVLDEADVLLDPLFRDQTLGIWNACINPDLHVTLWSATMGSNIESLATSTINARLDTLSVPPRPLIRLIVGLKDSALPTITHTLTYTATESGKLLALRQLLHPTGTHTASLRPPFLVFTQTIPRAIALHSELLYDIPPEAGGSSRLAVLHSDLSDSVRSSIMSRFRNGDIWVLITTDILSRGVDFRGVNGVVNYDVPNSGAAYIHRVGRTGRAGREGGVAVTFYTKEDIPYVKGIANIIAASEKAAGKPASEASMQRWLLDALPKTSKEEKKKLKAHGVEARRSGLGGKEKGGGKGRMRIGTKSGYERKLENRKRGAIEGSKRRSGLEQKVEVEQGEESEWGGLDD